MKKVFLISSFILMSFYTAYSIDCGDIDCPEGWTAGETGWVVIQLNQSTSCAGKICYCYDLDTLNNETPEFFIKKNNMDGYNLLSK